MTTLRFRRAIPVAIPDPLRLAAAATQPPVVGVPAWSATATYKVGDRVTRGGVTYQCLVAHGAEYAGTWGPPLPSVWAIVP